MKTLVIGGARSGKSAVAESLLRDRTDVTYVATGYHPVDDPEWEQRVARHQALRPDGWTTLETVDLEGVLRSAGGPLLVDCLTLWLTRRMDEHGCWDGAPLDVVRRDVERLVAALVQTDRDVVLVTNEVGQGVVPATASGRLFRDEMGLLNTAVAAACDDVLLCVAGRALRLP